MAIEGIYSNINYSTLNSNIGSTSVSASGSSFQSILQSTMDSSTGNDITAGNGLDSIFEEAAEKYDVPVNLLKAVAKAESNFRSDATSSCGAMGIMQLMPGTAKGLGVTDAYDPEQNIMGGAKYLSKLLNEFDGNTELAVAGYNAGAGNVNKYGGIPPFTETQNYVKKVMGYYNGDVTIPDYASGTASSGTEDSSSIIPTDSMLSSLVEGMGSELPGAMTTVYTNYLVQSALSALMKSQMTTTDTTTQNTITF